MHTRNTILMAVVFVVLAGFVYFYEIRGRAEREEAERQAGLLLHFEPEQVTELTIESDGERVVALRQDGEWSITEPAPVAADAETLDTLLDNVYRATHERLVGEAVEDLEPFGLAEPPHRVVVKLDDGSEQELRVGKDTPVGFNLYATAGDGNVYSAGRGLRGQVAKTLLDVRDRSILEFETTAVRQLHVDGPDLEARLVFDPDAGDGGQWSLEAPLQARADNETVDDILMELRDAEAEAFVLDETPDADTLAMYGLDAPARRVGIATGDDEWLRLLVGAASSEPAGHYAMREAGSSVFVVSDDLLEALPAGVDAFRNRQVVALAREQVRALEIESGADPIRLERQEASTDWRVVTPLALDADESAVSRLLSTLQDLRAESFGASGAGSGSRIVLELEGDANGVELTLGDTRREVTPVDGEADETLEARPVTVAGDPTVYWVDAADVDELEVDLFELRDKTLVEFTQADLTGIEVSDADGTTWQLMQEDGAWTASEGTVDSSTVDDLLWEMNYLRLESVEAETTPADLAPWGLERPRFRITARVGDDVAARITVGAAAEAGEDEAGRVFVAVDGREGVFAVSGGLVDAVEALIEELRQ